MARFFRPRGGARWIRIPRPLLSSILLRHWSRAFAVVSILLLSLPAAHAAPAIVATQDDGTPAATRKVPGDTITYTTVITNTAAVGAGNDATGVLLTNPTPANTTDFGSVTISPVTFNDTYPQTVIANIGINSANLPYSVTANDFAGSPATTTIASFTQPAHGTVTMVTSGVGIGQFTYEPAAGYTGADSFTYTLTNAVGSSIGTVNLTVAASPVIWFVNPAVATTGTGTLASPFKTVAEAVTAIGANTGQRIFLYSGSQTTGVSLRNNGWLIGQGAVGTSFDTVMGITPGSGANARPAINGTRPALSNSSGSVVTLADGNTLLGVAITGGATGAAVNGSAGGINTGIIGPDVTISGAGGGAFALGSGNGNFSVGAPITSATGRSVSVSGRTAGTVAFPASISDTGTGVSLSTNTGTTINFTGGLTLNTGGNMAFSATGGGTVNVTGASNNIGATTPLSTTALNIANTTIGGSGVTFKSISVNGGSSGIVLNNTGASGSLTVTGDGNTTVGGNNSGGTIQNTTSHGIALTGTFSPAFTNVQITNTFRSGISGTGVTNFTFKNGRIDKSGLNNSLAPVDTSTAAVDVSNIAFNQGLTGSTTNLSGTVVITQNTLTNAWYHGIDIYNTNGTIADANLSNNTITSAPTLSSSQGSGIRFIAFGVAASVPNITKATLNANTIKTISGPGIQVQGANASGTATAGNYGTVGSATNVINITNNTVSGYDATTGRMNVECIIALVNGRGQGNFNVTGNNVSNTLGTAISASSFGFANVALTINNNTVVANNTVAAQGIGIGTSSAFGSNTETPTLNATIQGNNISQTDGNGILAVARGTTSTVNLRILSNIVAAPLTGVRQGIRVDSGNSSSANETVCLNISGNKSAPSVGQPTALGIGLRKQGTVANVNAFSINGLSPSPTGTPNVENYVNGLNPMGGGTLLISATSGFTTCTLPLMIAPGGVDTARHLASEAPGSATGVSPAISDISREASSDSENSAALRDPPGTAPGVRAPAGLSQSELDGIVAAALARWEAAGLTDEQLARLRSITFEVSDDLPGRYLGEAEGRRVRVSSRAAGNGWFVDAAPQGDGQFTNAISPTRRYTHAACAPAGRVDLLTAVLHEMGHILGLPDTYEPQDRDSIMFGFLTKGERRLPARDQARGAAPGALPARPHFLASPVNLGTLPAGKSVTIKYSVTIGPIGGNPQQISSQGTVSGDNFSSVSTVDAVAGSGPTNTLLAIAPAFTSANATTFVVGSAGSFSVTANGAPPPSFSVTGALPSGVSLSPSGVLSGTPAAGTGGSYPITITANNGVSPNATQSFTLTVNQPPAITSANSTTFTVGTAGTFTVTTTGFPTPTLSVTGTLPAGVTFDAGTGVLSGTPAAGTGGTYTLQFKAANGVGSDATQSFTLTVNQPPAITSANATTFTAGTAGSFTVTTTGFPTSTITRTGGTLPAGVTLTNNGDGTATLAGTATAAGDYPITLKASNGVGSDATQSFTLTVSPGAATQFAITAPASTPAGAAFGFSVTARDASGNTATGYAGTVQFTSSDPAATLPANATLASGTGSFNATLNTVGGQTITATDTVTASISGTSGTITVSGTAPAITSAATATFTVGQSNTFTVTTTGNPPPTVGAGGTLPTGVTFTANANGTGTLSGNPAAGSNPSYPLTFTATNGVNPAASQSFTLVINRPPTAGADTLGTEQDKPVTAAVAKLLANDSDPDGDGLTISAITTPSSQSGTVTLSAPGNSGTITYTPAAGFKGTDVFTYTLSDGRGGLATGTVTVTVRDKNAPSLNVISITLTPQNTVLIKFAGIPGRTYQIQSTTDLNQPFTDVPGGQKTADAQGRFEFEDTTNSSVNSRFYRAIEPPASPPAVAAGTE